MATTNVSGCRQSGLLVEWSAPKAVRATSCRRDPWNGGSSKPRNASPSSGLTTTSVHRRSGASPGLNRRHARKQEVFNHRCTPMHADGPESGMCVHSKIRPTGHDEPRRCGGPCPIRVHPSASVVENFLLAPPHAAPTPQGVRSLRKQAPRARARTPPIGCDPCAVRSNTPRPSPERKMPGSDGQTHLATPYLTPTVTD